MQLISLELENFRQHKWTVLEFLPGVTGIIGKNGSGKTTILEAIAWALYGAPAIRGTYESLRCRAAEGDAPVEARLAFGIGPHAYTVARRLETSGKNTASLAIDGTPSRVGFREVSESIAKLLGMNYQAFFTSFFTAQKELEFMRGLSGRDRAKAISQMLGYERIVRAREGANQDRLGIAKEITGLEQGLGDPDEIRRRKEDARSAASAAQKVVEEAESAEAAARGEVERLKPLRDLSDEKSKRCGELSRRIELDKAEEKRASSRIHQIETELADLSAKEEELKSLETQLTEYREAEEEFRRLGELLKYESRRRELNGQVRTVADDEKSLAAQIEALAATPEEEKRVEQAVLALERQIEEIELGIRKEIDARSAARHRCEAELAQISAQLEDVAAKRRAIVEAGSSGKCPTCERPLAEEHPKVIAGFDRQLSALDSRAEKLRARLAELDETPAEVAALSTMRETLSREREDRRRLLEEVRGRSRELASCRDELARKQRQREQFQSDLARLPSGFDEERFNECRETGVRLKPIHRRSIELKTALERRPVLAADLEGETDALRRAKAEIAVSEKSLAELAFSPEEHATLVAAYENASAAHNAAEIRAERARGDLRAAQASLRAAEHDEKLYKARQAELRSKRRARAHLQALTDALDALRADLSSRTAPELAAAASDLLAEMTDGRYSTLEVDDNYEATIREDGEEKKVISGGEEDIVNLSLRLAVSRMIADRAGQELSLLVLDEVFGSLDDIRRENLVALLQTLKSRFEQIILITHVEAIHDAVDNCVWVDYDEAADTSKVSLRMDSAGVGFVE